jgi:hypothetical protein
MAALDAERAEEAGLPVAVDGVEATPVNMMAGLGWLVKNIK